MRILLVDIDSVIPNLALMKISTYHKQGGNMVGFNVDAPDMAYISVIFKQNRDRADMCANLLRVENPDIIIDIGGPGYDLAKVLPPEIEGGLPDYDLYPSIDYALGFTTRGCVRRCPFCIVPIKEGALHKVSTIERIYNPRFDQIKLLDNNVLADMDNFRHIAQFCIEHKVRIDISQGLDARLLTEESARLIKQLTPMRSFVFAFDSLAYKPAVERAISLLKDAGVDVRGKVQFYVYCDKSGGEYGLQSAIERCRLLKGWGTNAYVCLNIDTPPTPAMRHLKRWANRKHVFWAIDYDEYTTKSRTVNLSGVRPLEV